MASKALSDGKVRLSVQGCPFLLPSSDVTRHDWLVRTMVETDLPTDRVADALYLNCDAEAFRLVNMLVNGTASIDDVDHLSDVSLVVLRATAEYLLCSEVVAAIDGVVAKRVHDRKVLVTEAEQREAELRQQLRLKCEEADELRSKASFRAVMEKLISSRVSIRLYHCNGYRTHRPRNRCDTNVVVIGEIDSSDSLTCGYCSEAMTLMRRRVGIPAHEVIEDVDDLEGVFAVFDTC